MWESNLDAERYRVEQVLDILEHASRRLADRAYVPLTVIRDAVAFIDAAEAAHETGESNATEQSPSTGPKPHWRSTQALTGMKDALNALDSGDASAALRFARFTREYIDLRGIHLRADDSPSSRRLFDRLAEAATLLDVGGSMTRATTRVARFSAT